MADRTHRSVFDTDAGRYDFWYDTAGGKALLATEVACVRPLLAPLPRPHLEIGVGAGRFAQALGIDYGIDPAPSALELARRRGVATVLGMGERLPFRNAGIGGVLLAFSLCFVRDPSQLLREVRRVLRPDGGLVLDVLLKGTPWADAYAVRAAAGHPIYSAAHFYTGDQLETLWSDAGLHVTGYQSSLFQPPDRDAYVVEQPVIGLVPGAGFTAIPASPF